jgi:hypothetical protein
VAALLADAVGLTFHEILSSRIADLKARRPAMMEIINNRM